MSIQLGSAYGKIIIDASGVEKGTEQAVKSLAAVSGTAVVASKTAQIYGSRLQSINLWLKRNSIAMAKFGESVQEAGSRMLRFITLPIIGFFGLIINKALDADTALSKLGKESIANFSASLAKLGEKFLPLFIKILDGITAVIEKFLAADPKTQKTITMLVIGFGMILPVALKLIGFLIQVTSFLGGLGITAGTVGTFITGTLIPAVVGIAASIGSVILPIILIIATLGLLYLAFKNNFMGITTTAKQLWEIIKFYFSQITKKIVDAFKSINWGQIGKNMLTALANGMLMGIPSLVMVATRVAAAALDAIKKKLGIHSPSREFMKLGVFSGQGFQAGLANAMDPNTIARTMAKPVQNMSNNQQQNITMNLAGGLTLRQAQSMIAANNEMLMRNLSSAMGT